MAEYDPQEMLDAVRDAVEASEALHWAGDWFEPSLIDMPAVRARPAGFVPLGPAYREALEVQLIYGRRTKSMNYRGLTTAHAEALIALIETGYFPMLRPSPIRYAIRIVPKGTEYVGADFLLLSADVT